MFYHAAPSSDLTSSSHAERARVTTAEVDRLRSEMERLMMISEALWGLLKEKHGYRDADLAQRVAAIDMKDGALDGRVKKRPPQNCPHCRRKMIRRRMVCLYCGKPVLPDLFAR